MKATTGLILLAFLAALGKLEEPLPADLQLKINQAGKLLVTDLSAAARLLQQVLNDELAPAKFGELYEYEYGKLSDRYNDQLRKGRDNTKPEDESKGGIENFITNELPEVLPQIGEALSNPQPQVTIWQKIKDAISKSLEKRTPLDIALVASTHY